MKRFRFSLETLLRVRRLREDQARMELARLLKELQTKREALQKTEEDRQRVINKWTEQAGRGIKSQDYQLTQKYLISIKYIIADFKEQISRLAGEVQIQQEKLMKLSQDRKLMENLKEKKLQLYKEEVAAYLQKEADENALLRLNQDEKGEEKWSQD
jgi:flagellar protein FliJ